MKNLYLTVSGFIFLLVSLMHFFRVINSWDFNIGPYAFPMWISILGFFGAGALGIWALFIKRNN